MPVLAMSRRFSLRGLCIKRKPHQFGFWRPLLTATEEHGWSMTPCAAQNVPDTPLANLGLVCDSSLDANVTTECHRYPRVAWESKCAITKSNKPMDNAYCGWKNEKKKNALSWLILLLHAVCYLCVLRVSLCAKSWAVTRCNMPGQRNFQSRT